MKNKYNKLVILDYNKGIVHYYNVEKEVEINEEYINNLGFNSDEICWMCGEKLIIFEHNGILM